VRLVSEVLLALGAGAVALVVARRLGLEAHRAVGAVALVPVVAAVLFAAPALHDGVTRLVDEREENAPLTAYQAQVWPGSEIGMAVDFLAWVETQFAEGDTFHLKIGRIPGEAYVAGVGVRQAAILQWSLFQLGPHLAVEQSPTANDVEPGEGLNADWLVFYESEPEGYGPGTLGEVRTYAPGFGIARIRHAR